MNEKKYNVAIIYDLNGNVVYVGKNKYVSEDELNRLTNEVAKNNEEKSRYNEELIKRIEQLEKELKDIKGE